MNIAFVTEYEQNKKTSGDAQLFDLAQRLTLFGNNVFMFVNEENIGAKKTPRIQYFFLATFFSKTITKFFNLVAVALRALFEKIDIVFLFGEQSNSFMWLTAIISPKTKYVKLAEGEKFAVHAEEHAMREDALQEDIIASLGLRDKRYILAVGPLTKESGVHYLIEAFKQLEDRASTPNNFKLVIEGEGESDDEYLTFLKVISEGRSTILFTCLMNSAYLKQLYAHAYLYVQPAEILGSPQRLLEAMSNSVSPLVSSTKINKTIVGKDGFVFESESIEDLRDKLAYVLNRPDIAMQIGERVQKRINSKFGWDAFVQSQLKLQRK